jgi:phosphatidylserine decarboxylase
VIESMVKAGLFNFWLTNHVPRLALTRLMGWFSKIEQPLVRDLSIAVWRAMSDLDLSEARKSTFTSLHDCFTRELKDGARRFDQRPDVLACPSDGIVMACGRIERGLLMQAKGLDYRLDELLVDAELARSFEGGSYATLRLTATMYHRFHAPLAGRVERIDYVAGDAWNVNPPTVARVERLYCRNERAVVRLRESSRGGLIALVPVAAILVASIRFRFFDVRLHLDYRGPNRIDCDAALGKGEEMGWFEHGSTIIVLAPPGYALERGVMRGIRVRAGEGLMRFEGGHGRPPDSCSGHVDVKPCQCV